MGLPRLRGDMFGDDQGEISPLSVSMLYACNDGKDYRPALDQLQKEGVESGRWFASKLTPSDTRTGNSLERAEEVSLAIADDLRDRKMWGHASGFCDTGSWADWARLDAHARWFGSFLVAHPWVVGEGVNEIDHPSQMPMSVSDIQRIIDGIRGTGYVGPLTAGAWLKADELVAGKYKPGEVQRCGVIDTHFERTGEPAWDMANHGFSELRVIVVDGYEGNARMSGEPKRCDDGPVWPPGVWPYLLAIEAQGFNTWTTLHSSPLRDCNVLDGQNLEDLRTYIRAGHILPRGRYHFENAGWGGSPVRNAAFCEWGPDKPPTATTKAVWRAHSFRHEATGQWFLVTYGPDALHPVIEFQNGFSYDKEIDRLGQYVTVHTLKQG